MVIAGRNTNVVLGRLAFRIWAVAMNEKYGPNEKESGAMLTRLQHAVIKDENVFAVHMDAVRCCSLGQITHSLFEPGNNIGTKGDRRSCGRSKSAAPL